MKLNLVLLPNESFNRKVLSLAKKISKNQKTLFYIDGINFIPHISLTQKDYQDINDIDKIFAQLTKIFKKSKLKYLTFKKFSPGKNYIMLDFKKNINLKSFYQNVSQLLGLKINYDQFRPHLTLARFGKKSIAEKIVNHLNSSFVFGRTKISKIALTKIGPNGASTKIVKYFEK